MKNIKKKTCKKNIYKGGNFFHKEDVSYKTIKHIEKYIYADDKSINKFHDIISKNKENIITNLNKFKNNLKTQLDFKTLFASAIAKYYHSQKHITNKEEAKNLSRIIIEIINDMNITNKELQFINQNIIEIFYKIIVNKIKNIRTTSRSKSSHLGLGGLVLPAF